MAEKIEGGFPLAVLLEGQFSDTFDGAAAPAWPAEAGPAGEAAIEPATERGGSAASGGQKMEGPKPGRLLVVGSAKVFSDDLLQNPGNIGFFANSIDGLALGPDIVKIRSKAVIVRDIPRLSNANKFWIKFFTVGLVPILLIIFAGIRLFFRRKEKSMYVAAVGLKEGA